MTSHIRNDVDLLSLGLLRNAFCQLRRSGFDAATRWNCSHNDFDAIMRQRLCDASPVLQSRKEVSRKAKFVET